MRICGFRLFSKSALFDVRTGPWWFPQVGDNTSGQVLVPLVLVLTPCRYLEDKQLCQAAKTLTDAVFQEICEKRKILLCVKNE